MPDVPIRPDSRPLYHRIASALRAEVVSGRLVPGTQLPPIAALSETYAVAAVTVRQALKLLTDEGLIRSRRGSGTFVAERLSPGPLPVLDLGWPLLPTFLRNHRGRILEAEDRMPPLRESDGVPAAAYRRMLRVHSDETGAAYAVAEIYLDRRCYALAPRRFDQEMVLSLLEEMLGDELPEMRQSFNLTAADASVAAHLNIQTGDPIGRLRRVLLHASGEVAYFAITLSRADRVAFEWVLRRPGAAAPAADVRGEFRGTLSTPAAEPARMKGRVGRPKSRRPE